MSLLLQLNLGFGWSATSGVAPTVTTTTLANGTQGTAYSATLTATGDTPITWAVSAGSLPAGLSLSTGGVLSGTPSWYGSSSFTVEATNAYGSDTQVLGLTVTETANAGGFWSGFEEAQTRRRKRFKELDDAEDEAQRVKDAIDREIALLLREQERLDAERAERERLRTLAQRYNTDRAAELFGERVAKAMSRAAVQGNFSALEAFAREAARAQEEEIFLLHAAALAIELDG